MTPTNRIKWITLIRFHHMKTGDLKSPKDSQHMDIYSLCTSNGCQTCASASTNKSGGLFFNYKESFSLFSLLLSIVNIDSSVLMMVCWDKLLFTRISGKKCIYLYIPFARPLQDLIVTTMKFFLQHKSSWNLTRASSQRDIGREQRWKCLWIIRSGTSSFSQNTSYKC